VIQTDERGADVDVIERVTTAYVHPAIRYIASVTARTLDLRSRGRGFDSRSGRYQVVTTWTGDCLRTGKPSRYITNTKINSAFHP